MWNAMRAFMRKEMHHILRDRQTLTILLLMPLVQVVLFGYALRSDVREIRLAVVDRGVVTRGAGKKLAQQRREHGGIGRSGRVRSGRVRSGRARSGRDARRNDRRTDRRDDEAGGNQRGHQECVHRETSNRGQSTCETTARRIAWTRRERERIPRPRTTLLREEQRTLYGAAMTSRLHTPRRARLTP